MDWTMGNSLHNHRKMHCVVSKIVQQATNYNW